MKNRPGDWWQVLLLFVIFGLALSSGLFVDENIAIRALEKQGYSHVEIIKRNRFFVSFRGCANRDAAKFTARATNPAGKTVEVFVCAGWLFKGAIVRTD